MHVIFYLVLSWVRYLHKICLHYSPQDQKIAEMIQITPFKSLEPLVLNTVWGYLDDPRLFFCLCWLFMSPLFVPEQFELSTVLQTNPPRFCRFLQFSSIFCIFEPFPAVTVWFWDPSFHTEDNWGTQTQLLKKVQTFTDAPEGNTMH